MKNRYIISMLTIVICHCLLPMTAFGNGDNSVYPAIVMDKSYTFILGTVDHVDDEKKSEVNYELKVVSDMRDIVKTGSTVTVHGYDVLTFGPNTNIPTFRVGDVVFLFAKSTANPTRFEYEVAPIEPLGFDLEEPIDRHDVAEVKLALKELSKAVAAPGGASPSKQRVNELLEEKNYYLWALGVWRLGRMAETDDVNRLKDQISRKDTTPRRILWLDKVVTQFSNGPAVDSLMDLTVQHGLLVKGLDAYVMNHPRNNP